MQGFSGFLTAVSTNRQAWLDELSTFFSRGGELGEASTAPRFLIMNENFIFQTYLEDVSFCDKVINFFHQESTEKQPGSAGREVNYDVKKSTDTLLDYSPSLYHTYCKELTRIINLYGEKYPEINDVYWQLVEKINLQHYAPGEGFYQYHYERMVYTLLQYRRYLVFMTYLNDVTEGGETQFKYQGIKVQPKKGLTLIWPTDWMHTHKGIPSLTQDKYILTGWMTAMPIKTSNWNHEDAV